MNAENIPHCRGDGVARKGKYGGMTLTNEMSLLCWPLRLYSVHICLVQGQGEFTPSAMWGCGKGMRHTTKG